jgi:hypothetical protein
MLLLGFALKEHFEKVDYDWDVYGDSDDVWPNRKVHCEVVNQDAHACAQSVSKSENRKGKSPFPKRNQRWDRDDPKGDFDVVVWVLPVAAKQYSRH